MARRRALRTVAIAGSLIIAAVSSVIYIQLQEVARERDAAIARAKQADEARRHAEELSAKADDAMKQANEAFERFQQAVLAENRARSAGDAERMRQLAEARRKAEEDANQRRQVAEALVRQANDAKRNAPAVVVAAPTTAATKAPGQEPANAPVANVATPAASGTRPTEAASAPPPTGSASPNAFQVAQSLEAKNGKEAVRAYSALAKGGNCEAARRLGQIYEKGVRDVPRDYQESLQWYRRAEQLGCKVTRAAGRA
jgi:TPR repeat protein